MEKKIFLNADREDFQNLCIVARRQGITFTKAEAARWVGSRYRLEALVAEKKIRMEKSSPRQNASWRCMAEDVLRYAYRYI